MHRLGWLCGVLSLATIFGCGGRPPAVAPPGTPEVIVTRPVLKEVVDYEDFTGWTRAVADVEVRARVTGYLEKVLFTEGTEVKKGTPLFLIDPRPYAALLHSAEASLAQDRATLDLAKTEFARAAQLMPKNAIAGTDYDQAKNAVEVAKARVKSSEAAVETANLNLNFCSIPAPIDGRISRQLIDPNNMVQADQTALTTIVTQDPIYAYFDEDERTMLRVRRLIREGKVKSVREAKLTIFLGLADEEGFPHKGVVDFIDNRVDQNTGTLRLRGVFPNPKRAASAVRILSPGMFVRIRVPIGDPHQSLLISEQALGSDQANKFVYVVNQKNEVTYRRVEVGSLQDGLRVIEKGLAANERVVVSGLQRIRPGIKIQPKMAAEMSAQAGPATTPSTTKPKPVAESRPSS
jgi:RND family efflux transporter MFP subunit